MTTSPFVLTTASASFEAARQVPGLRPGHRLGALHGHGFEATVFAQLPADFAPYAGGEVDALQAALAACIQPLNYAHLNEVLPEPSDAQLARWIAQQLSAQTGLPAIERVALRSTPMCGVDWQADGASGRVQLWRRFRFQSAHRLPNVPLGHKCGRMHGHGFEAVVHAWQDGAGTAPIDHDTLDAVWAPLHMQLNYQCLNEIDGLDNPTSENLSAWIWAKLQPELPQLAGVTVFETGSCGAHFDGEHYRIWKEFTLDSAVRLAQAPAGSPRRGLHGHTYTLRLHLEAPLDVVMGWTVDFGDVKTQFNRLFKAIDHVTLHELPGVPDGDAASVAQWLLAQARPQLPSLARVDLYETPGTGCVVSHAPVTVLMPV